MVYSNLREGIKRNLSLFSLYFSIKRAFESFRIFYRLYYEKGGRGRMELAIIALSFVVMYLTFVTSLYFTTDKFRSDKKRRNK